MGRRFPEFCTLTAACRVSVRASSSATGDGRVASYRAAIESIGRQHYTHRPFMVEVLNKWLETNQDFIRDPLSYVAPDSSPAPTLATTTTVASTQAQDRTANQTTASATPACGPPTTAGDVALPLSRGVEVSKHTVDSSPAASTTGTEPSGSDDPTSTPPSSGASSAPIPILKTIPLPWVGAFHFPPSLGNLGVGNLTTKTGWLRLFFAGSYKGWWEIFRKTFVFRSG